MTKRARRSTTDTEAQERDRSAEKQAVRTLSARGRARYAALLDRLGR